MFKCPNPGCECTCKTDANLILHLKYECGKSPIFKCLHCPFESNWSSNVRKHIKRVHKGLEVSVIRTSATKKTKTKTNNEDAKKKYKCYNPNCDCTYNHKTDLYKHVKYKCGKLPSFMCSYCYYKSYWARAVRDHIKVMHKTQIANVVKLDGTESFDDLNDKIFKCPNPSCPCTYKYEGSLIEHLKYECGKLPRYKCSDCAYGSRWVKRIRQHIRHAHKAQDVNIVRIIPTKTNENEDTRLFKCPNLGCKCVYKYKHGLNRHLKYECEKSSSFNCPNCSLSTSWNNTLRVNVRREQNTSIDNLNKSKSIEEKMTHTCPNVGCKCAYEHRGLLSRHLKNECGIIPCYKYMELSDSLIDTSDICFYGPRR